MSEIRILGLLITDRIKESGYTQEVLSRYGHVIKTRLGFHEVTENVCSRLGVIILRLSGPPSECDRLEAELNKIGGLEVQRMLFAC